MSTKLNVKKDEHNFKFLTTLDGYEIIRNPLLNKGTAFTKEERKNLGIQGMIPPGILSLKDQIEKIYQKYKNLDVHYNSEDEKSLDIARFNFLRDLQDRNEILFYAFCKTYLEEVLPIIYTPTVGDAVMRYSKDSARFRGVFICPSTLNHIQDILSNFRYKNPTIAVVTDNQGILGIGDQGIGGIDIPIGKLALYVLCAGVRPWETLPLTLDVGTNNEEELTDSYYLGYKSNRLTGKKYDEFIDIFVKEITEKFPNILIQWEDFSKQNAFSILEKYQYKILSFNDDIQGTGAVALAGILNALKINNEELSRQRFVIYGAGAGGVGIAKQISSCLVSEYNLSEKQANDLIVLIDSKGMLTDERKMQEYKKPFSKNNTFYKSWNVENFESFSLLDVVKNFQPTVLIGTSGQPGHFDETIIKEMTKNTSNPVIFPMSNPNSKSEADPQDVYKFTKGKAIVATGSPFKPFNFEGKKISIAQGNNLYIFPGVGLGAIFSKAKYISDQVFTTAAYTLADMTPDYLLKKKIVYPNIKNIRDISANIAHEVSKQVSVEQNTKELSLKEIKNMMWKPMYSKIEKTIK